MFSSDSFAFLQQLGQNNDKIWFNEHKAEYESKVRGPALDFISQMEPLITEISPRFVASAKKVGGSLMRVHRDTRFSKGKLPYKTNIGIHFRHFMGKDAHAPGFYVHLANDECFIGAGIWRPDGPSLNNIRSFIDENPKSWLKTTTNPQFASCYQLSGESLIRPPRGFTVDHPLLVDLKRKDFIAIAPVDKATVLQGDFVSHVANTFKKADDYMYYLCSALDFAYR